MLQTMRQCALIATMLLGVAACSSTPETTDVVSNGGRRVVPESELRDVAAVQLRHLDSVNAIRLDRNAPPLSYNQALNSAALTHARDMALQQRAWHFGSDRSNPQSRAFRSGYTGSVLGENIAEAFEGEFDTLQNWLESPQTAALILNRQASDFGFGWYREPSGKLWWVQMFGTGAGRPGF